MNSQKRFLLHFLSLPLTFIWLFLASNNGIFVKEKKASKWSFSYHLCMYVLQDICGQPKKKDNDENKLAKEFHNWKNKTKSISFGWCYFLSSDGQLQESAFRRRNVRKMKMKSNQRNSIIRYVWHNQLTLIMG